MKGFLQTINWWLWLPLGIGLALRFSLLVVNGTSLTLSSDDHGYIQSAIHLLAHGELIYANPNEPTVHIMPGISFLLATVFFVFGSGDTGLIAAKVLMILFGGLSIVGVYKIGQHLFSPLAGTIGAMITALYIPQILTDNLILTESPFTAALIGFVYFSIKLADTHKNTDFYWVIGLYLGMIMLRPTIALIPLLLLLYFILKKYPIKIAKKQFVIAAILLLIVLTPWWIRNYLAYEEFIPLSGGAGNPMLLGTYQGHGYKYGDPFKQVVLELEEQYPEASRYEQNKYQMEAAKDRLSLMWNHNKEWFIETYTWIKLNAQWEAPFYWIEIFGVSFEEMKTAYLIVFWTGLSSLVSLLFFYRGHRKEIFFISLLVIYFTILNNIYFAYPRYNQPLLPFLFMAIGGAIHIIMRRVK